MNIKINENDTILTDGIGFSNCGTRLYYKIKYKWSEEDKCMVPYFDKPVDMFKMIQASKNATDINAIVQRAAAGDVSVINVKNGAYEDISEIPDNLNDMHNLNIEAINSFSKLDPKLQVLFDNDFNKFAAAVADGSYITTINNVILANNKVEEKPESDGDK